MRRPLKNTRYLHKSFAKMPCQAIHAKCGGIKPKKLCAADDWGKWNPDSISCFFQLVSPTVHGEKHKKGVIAQIMSKKPNKKLELVLFDTVSNGKTNGININAKLIEKGFAIRDKKWLKDGYLPWELALLKWKIKEAKKVQDHDDNDKFKLSELDDSAFSSRMKVQQWSAKNDALKPCGVIKPNRSK